MSFGTIISDIINGKWHGLFGDYVPGGQAYVPIGAVRPGAAGLTNPYAWQNGDTPVKQQTQDEYLELFGYNDPPATTSGTTSNPSYGGLISYPSETNGAWRNQKSFVNNKGDGSWDGLPDYLRHRNDDIDTTTYYR